MIVPALIYLALTNGERALQRGWAIPAATDIAFALAVLALLGNRAPTSLKLLLLTIAIVDDMGAVAIIAVAYTDTLNLSALAGAAAIMLAMHVLARGRVTLLWPYLLCAALLWYAVLLSGIHATIAGVLAAFMMPVTPTPGQPDAKDSVLHRAENILHPWSAYLIVPLFGFANAGVPLHGLGAGALMSPLPLAIAAGLVLGKQMGIFGSIWLCVRCGIATMPRGATWAQIYGLSVLCGIGFTMSLFIGALAFPGSPELVEAAKVGTLAGSMIAAVMGYSVLRRAALHPDHEAIEAAQTHEIDADGDVAQ
jgi:NhaA family Na+:H+ antiporter